MKTKRAPRQPTRGPKVVVLAERTASPSPAVEDAAHWAKLASIAEELATKLQIVATWLREDSRSPEERNALARDVTKLYWQHLGYSGEDKQVAISFVLAVEDVASLRNLFLHGGGLPGMPAAYYARQAHRAFARQWPRHARKLSVGDMEQALRAVDGTEPGGKWQTLATLVRERLKINVKADTLRQYVMRFNAAVSERTAL